MIKCWVQRPELCPRPYGNLYYDEYSMHIHLLHQHPFLLLWWVSKWPAVLADIKVLHHMPKKVILRLDCLVHMEILSLWYEITASLAFFLESDFKTSKKKSFLSVRFILKKFYINSWTVCVCCDCACSKWHDPVVSQQYPILCECFYLGCFYCCSKTKLLCKCQCAVTLFFNQAY